MNEIDKMRNSQLADMEKPEIQASFIYAKKLVAQLRMMSTYDDGFREVLEELVPGIPSTSVICPPFYCDHGHGIRLGEHVFVNANGSPDKPGGLSIQLCKSEKKEFYIRYSS